MAEGKVDGVPITSQNRPESTLNDPRLLNFLPLGEFIEIDEKQTIEEFRGHMDELKEMDTEYAGILDSTPAVGESLEKLFHHSKWTARHSAEVGFLASAAGKYVGFTGERLRDFVIGATLHDMGKLQVDKAVLDKVGRLETDEEKGQIHAHPANSFIDIASMPSINLRAALVAFGHHSVQWDPYPFDALDNDAIPHVAKMLSDIQELHIPGMNREALAAFSSSEHIERIYSELEEEWKIVTAADVVHALRSFRPYKGSYPAGVVRERTKNYDPSLVNVLLQAYYRIPTLHGENQLSQPQIPIEPVQNS